MQNSQSNSAKYLYIVICILVLIIGYFIYTANIKSETVEERVKTLQMDDILVFQVRNTDEYAFSRILSNANDTIYMNHANFTIIGEQPTQASYETEFAKETEFFSKNMYYFTQKQIDSLYVKGEIVNILKYKE